MSMFRIRRDGYGFTLLEVLVSLIVLGISLGAVFQALSQSKRISWKADEILMVTRIAHNMFTNEQLIRNAIREQEIEGDLEDEPQWKYTVTVLPLEVEIDVQGNTEENDDALIPPEKTRLEVPQMHEMELCLIHASEIKERKICMKRWFRR